jgi:murein L,D-transpeptidase YcbB/YkuD
MKWIILIWLGLALAGWQCTGSAGSRAEASSRAPVETRVAPAQAVADWRLDSAQVAAFVEGAGLEEKTAEALHRFYAGRDYQFAWLSEEGLTEHGQAVWSLHHDYLEYSRDSSAYDRQLHQEVASLVDEAPEGVDADPDSLGRLELQLTAHFIRFSSQALGGRVDPGAVQWHLPRRKIDAAQLLDSLTRSETDDLEALLPRSPQYLALRKAVLRYDALAKAPRRPIEMEERKVLRQGDSAGAVGQLKARLHLLGDYTPADTGTRFTPALEAAVKRYQQRHGLTPDGIVGPAVLRTLAVPAEERIEQLLVNMERLRWLAPLPEGGTSIVVNIPEFRLHLYEEGKEAFSMRIVVGKAANRTVIFSDELEYVVFSPYWNVPASIVRNEIQPAMRRNSSYLARNNMEITGQRNGLPVIRQRPGGSNALGRVKFIFPNQYAIYFHDTPAKTLFEETRRAFSHGCIRLQEPEKLAAYLLRASPAWDREKIRQHMNSGTEKWVKLEEKVPVRLVYLTAWVDEKGDLQFRDDIYGHDRQLKSRLFNASGTEG